MKKDHEAFASSMTVQQREYVDALVENKIKTLVAPLISEASALTSQNKKLIAAIDDLKLRVEAFESNFIDDKKYILTRAKIVALLKKEGIN